MTAAGAGGVKTTAADARGNADAPLAKQFKRAEARSHDLDSLSLLRRGHSLVGATSASRPPTARRGRSDHEMHTIDAARRDAPATNNRAHSAAPTGRVQPTSSKAAEGATHPATTITAGRSNVQPPELQACRLLGGVAGGGRFFIKNPPTPATPSHVRAIREWGVVA